MLKRTNARTLLRRRSGTELLELGLVAFPILLCIIFGTIEFGTYFYVEHNLQAAAREGARAGVVMNTAEEAEGVALDAIDRVFAGSSLSQFKAEGGGTFTPDVELDWNDAEGYFSVSISTTWGQIPNGLRPMLLAREDAVLKGFASMRIESQTTTP